ncbi:MAG TPA: cytochrome P460 family protein [Bryobacteraceae bacterium]|nr:cytochrome P460 family protein [Bryobacteraceae bacterium]
MTRFGRAVLCVAGSLLCLTAQPRYAGDGQLTLPSDYREWVFLSSGLGMTYGAEHQGAPSFTNVFANPAAYRSFLANGKWPDKTTLILEVRASASKGSINRAGSYQGDVLAVEAEVKDAAKFPGNGWAFFAFGKSSTGRLLARTEECYSCHAGHAAVDNTFVQFYPVLLEIAKQKGTLAPAYVHESAAQH